MQRVGLPHPKQLAKSLLASAPSYALLQARAHRGNPVTVVCYHTLRPDAEHLDAWTAARRSDFVAQMQFLRSRYDIVSLDEAASETAEPRRARPRAVVTFDDGEVGLHDTLLPIVADLRLPVTIYIATGQIERQKPYWFDEVMNALQADGPFTVDLTAQGLGAWTVAPELGKARWGVIGDILQALKDVPPTAREALADAIVAQAPRQRDRSLKPLQPLSLAQLRELAASEFVTIGAHSHCHSLLDQISPDEVAHSVARSRTLLEQWTGKPVRHFAYPNGNHNPSVEKIVADLGFRTAVALTDRLWHRGANPFALPRVSIGRYDDFDRFKLRLVQC